MSETLQDAVTTSSTTFERNMAAFREHAPRLHAVLKGIGEPHSRLDVGDDGSVDIVLHGKPLYGSDAVAFTQAQLDTYFARPVRHMMGAPRPEMIPGLAGDYCLSLVDAATRDGIVFDAERRAEDSWFTIVFGIGLGLHLQPLAERTRCRALVLVEPIVENIYHSLFVVDWQKIFAPADGSNRRVHFVTETEQEIIASALRTVVREEGATMLDGLYVYRHYPLMTLIRAEDQFQRDLYLHMVGLGFFEDELVMTANSVGNLARGDVRVITHAVPVHDTPVIMCGSGPSIDGCFEQIRALGERAVIVSLGSSLRSLLLHGIRPDFHIEMENEIDNANNLCKTDDEFGLHGITLVASTTVQPYGAERFDDIVLYFRDRVSSSYLFGRGIEWLGSCGPTVTNAALIALLYLGFRNFHFFGVDMGSRDAARYHAADTFIGMGQAREWGSSQRVPVVANFGGTAYAEGVLRWSRLAIETVVRLHEDVTVVNCSDGARIAGTIPMLPHRLAITTPPVDRAALHAMLNEQLPVFGAERRRSVWDRAHQEAELTGLLERIGALADRAEADPDVPLDWLKAVYDEVVYDSSSPAAPCYLFGSLTLLVGATSWYDRRIADTAQRDRFRRLAAAQLRCTLARAHKRLLKLFDNIDAVFAGRLDAVETDPIVPPAANFPGEAPSEAHKAAAHRLAIQA